MAIRKSFIPDDIVEPILKRIQELLDEHKKVRYVNVHCVGSEFRIGFCSLENILGKHYTWREGIHSTTTLVKSQYDRIHEVLDKAWKEQPVPIYEDRGLY